MTDHSKKDVATAQFNKLQRAEDGKKAMSEYEAQAAAVRAKTARLRELRLAREAEQAPVVPAKKAPATKAKAKNGANGTLADWLKAQERSGRNS